MPGSVELELWSWIKEAARQAPIIAGLILFIWAINKGKLHLDREVLHREETHKKEIATFELRLLESKEMCKKKEMECEKLIEIVKSNTSTTTAAVDGFEKATRALIDKERRRGG